MEDKEKIKQRYELIKMARELLNEDYANKRAVDHNKWVADNDEAWRTGRRNVPYPPIAQIPTDKEILKTAVNLYNFINGGVGPESEPDDTPLQQPVQPVEPAPEPSDIVSPITSPVTAVEETLPTTVPLDDEVIPNTAPPDQAEELQTISDKLDPSDVALAMLQLQIEEQKKPIKDRSFLPAWVKRTLD